MTGPSGLESFRRDLNELIRARFPIIHVVTREEERALDEIAALAKSLSCVLVYWSANRGVFHTDEDGDTTEDRPVTRHVSMTDDIASAFDVFEQLAQRKQKHFLFVCLDPFPFLADRNASPVVIRKIKEFAQNSRQGGHHAVCIMVSTACDIPPSLSPYLSVIEFPLPDRQVIREILHELVETYKDSTIISIRDGVSLADAFVDAAVGLTVGEIRSALGRVIVSDRRLDLSNIDKVFQQKRQMVRKSGLLEYCDTHGLSQDQVGGLEALKTWLSLREDALSENARAFGVAAPKGVLVAGIPGCGKSLSAKCVAASWHLPLIRLDMGKIYSPLVGSSEQHIRDAIQICEAVAPCVLWIDELEKGLPRMGSFIGDTGVSLRVLGSFLTWMQEKSAPVFVFATANQIDLLAPEVLRKGRFDEIFFVDLPTPEERREILSIHLDLARRDPNKFDLDELVELSGEEQFGEGVVLTGAELASWVNEALLRAYHRRRADSAADVTMGDFRATVRRIVPLARMRASEIQGMRCWAEEHAVHASLGAVADKHDGGVAKPR